MNILVLSPYAPWPPYGGGTMRIYQLLRGLAQSHTVTCLTFVADEGTLTQMHQQLAPVTVVAVVGPAPRSLWRRAWQMVSSPLPDMALRNQDLHYQHQLRALLATTQFDVVLACSIEMAPYVQTVQQHGIPSVLDEFNAEYVIQKRAALTDIRQPKRWHAALYSLVQWAKLRAFEADVLARVDAVTVVSDDDGATLQQLVPKLQPVLIPNGVDTTYFDATQVVAHAYTQPTIVFSGTLDYRPNVDAVRWFVHEVFPLIRQQLPQTQLVVVGRRPTAELQALHDAGVIVLTGEVADTRPYLCGAQVYVVPMRIGGGVRLKVLEAMALGMPIVSTALGIAGIDHMPAGTCVVADTPSAMAQAVVATLTQSASDALRRQFVTTHYEWRVIVPRLDALLSAVVSRFGASRI